MLECPICLIGTLTVEKDAIHTTISRATSNWSDWGDPSDIRGTFYGHLKCNSSACGDVVATAGDFAVEPSGLPHPYEMFETMLTVRTIYPPIRIVEISDSTPNTVQIDLRRAAAAAWCDPSSAISLLRSSVERVMDDQGIITTDPTGRRMSLHKRLEEFEKTNPDVAELLLAAKWVGNEGTHQTGLSASDFLDIAEIVELALTLLYTPKESSRVRDRAKRITAAKKLVL